jgi:hypothetical protein
MWRRSSPSHREGGRPLVRVADGPRPGGIPGHCRGPADPSDPRLSDDSACSGEAPSRSGRSWRTSSRTPRVVGPSRPRPDSIATSGPGSVLKARSPTSLGSVPWTLPDAAHGPLAALRTISIGGSIGTTSTSPPTPWPISAKGSRGSRGALSTNRRPPSWPTGSRPGGEREGPLLDRLDDPGRQLSASGVRSPGPSIMSLPDVPVSGKNWLGRVGGAGLRAHTAASQLQGHGRSGPRPGEGFDHQVARAWCRAG